LFNYHPPRFYFSAGEQRLLNCAISNGSGTNQVLAKSLGLSLSTVKKMWLSIYGRVAEQAPELILPVAETGIESKRGKEKRRRLLAYLQEHPEELRSVSRKPNDQKSHQAPPSAGA
jgi:hypothetical protein